MISAIIVAAGKSTRMGGQTDKLFLPVAGRPLVAHAWQRFDGAPFIDEIVLVVRDGRQSAFAQLAAQYHFAKPFRFAPGGKERQDSVWNGLEDLSPRSEIVAIQDAARPCTSLALIEATIAAARQTGAAVAAQPVSDTIKHSDDGAFVTRHLDRSRLWAVQTPQTFRVEVIRRALAHGDPVEGAPFGFHPHVGVAGKHGARDDRSRRRALRRDAHQRDCSAAALGSRCVSR